MEKYLRDKKLQRPMLGAQRRIEARIGQLCDSSEKGGRGKTVGHDLQFISKDDRVDFRILARALDGEMEEPPTHALKRRPKKARETSRRRAQGKRARKAKRRKKNRRGLPPMRSWSAVTAA